MVLPVSRDNSAKVIFRFLSNISIISASVIFNPLNKGPISLGPDCLRGLQYWNDSVFIA